MLLTLVRNASTPCPQSTGFHVNSPCAMFWNV